MRWPRGKPAGVPSESQRRRTSSEVRTVLDGEENPTSTAAAAAAGLPARALAANAPHIRVRGPEKSSIAAKCDMRGNQCCGKSPCSDPFWSRARKWHESCCSQPPPARSSHNISVNIAGNDEASSSSNISGKKGAGSELEEVKETVRDLSTKVATNSPQRETRIRRLKLGFSAQ